MIHNIPLNALRPQRWERLEGNNFFIGSHLAGTLQGDRVRGYIAYPAGSRIHFWSQNITKTIRRLRSHYWSERMP